MYYYKQIYTMEKQELLRPLENKIEKRLKR